MVEIGSPHIYASFATFCAYFGQLIERYTVHLQKWGFVNFLFAHCASIYWPILKLKVPKEERRFELQTSRFFSEIFGYEL